MLLSAATSSFTCVYLSRSVNHIADCCCASERLALRVRPSFRCLDYYLRVLEVGVGAIPPVLICTLSKSATPINSVIRIQASTQNKSLGIRNASMPGIEYREEATRLATFRRKNRVLDRPLPRTSVRWCRRFAFFQTFSNFR